MISEGLTAVGIVVRGSHEVPSAMLPEDLLTSNLNLTWPEKIMYRHIPVPPFIGRSIQSDSSNKVLHDPDTLT